MPSAALQSQRPPRRSQRPALRHAPPRIVVLGDSLTAGLGLAPAAGVPSADPAAPARGRLPDYEVVNAGVSGDTSAGGLRRLDWALEGDVRVLIVALGGNDALRGLPADELKQNLVDDHRARAGAAHHA